MLDRLQGLCVYASLLQDAPGLLVQRFDHGEALSFNCILQRAQWCRIRLMANAIETFQCWVLHHLSALTSYLGQRYLEASLGLRRSPSCEAPEWR